MMATRPRVNDITDLGQVGRHAGLQRARLAARAHEEYGAAAVQRAAGQRRHGEVHAVERLVKRRHGGGWLLDGSGRHQKEEE